MLVKRERFYIKKVKQSGYYTKVGEQYIKQTSFWLFGIIPLLRGIVWEEENGQKMKKLICIEGI